MNRYGFEKGGWSTRTKDSTRTLSKHVNSYPNLSSKKKYRVCRKVNGKTVTFGYFNTQYEANAYKSACFKGT